MKKQQHINWTVSLFLLFTPLVGISGLVYLIANHGIFWQTILLMFVYMAMTGFSITAGYHRLFSHKSYAAHPVARWLFVFFGSGAFEGSVMEWCTDHRNHHRHVDTEQDPYNINAGLFYAHIGWLLVLDNDKRDFSNVKDLNADPVIYYQNKFYIPTAILSGFIVPMAIASLWGDLLGGFLLASCLRIVMNHHLTFFINSICHFFGKQTYTDENTARDNWLTAFFTYGEGYHNFHHKFPIDYRNGIRAFHFDPTKWLIRGLSWLGLARDLKRVNHQRIIQCKLDMDSKRSQARNERFQQLAQPIYNMLLNASSRLDELERGYHQLKAKKALYVRDKVQEYHNMMNDYRKQIQQAKHDMKMLKKMWKHLLCGPVLA